VSDVTKKGFKAVIVREEAYDLANRQAQVDQTSIADIVTKAIQRYINRRLETEEELRTLIKVYEEHKEQKSRALSFP
jgi:hypothetical protein